MSAAGHAHHHGEHGHSHGLVDDSIKRSRAGVRAVLVSLAVLGLAAVAQTVVYVLSGSVALLADLIHNFGDASTAIPLGIAFALRSERAERGAGLFVVATIFVSACVAGIEAIHRLIDPSRPDHLAALALAGVIGFAGNLAAARIRTRAGHRLDSPALLADGDHARADAWVSLAVVASAAVVALGLPIADPLIGLAITVVILRITWQSWTTVRHGHTHAHCRLDALDPLPGRDHAAHDQLGDQRPAHQLDRDEREQHDELRRRRPGRARAAEDQADERPRQRDQADAARLVDHRDQRRAHGAADRRGQRGPRVVAQAQARLDLVHLLAQRLDQPPAGDDRRGHRAADEDPRRGDGGPRRRGEGADGDQHAGRADGRDGDREQRPRPARGRSAAAGGPRSAPR